MSNWVLAVGVAVLACAACALLGLYRKFAGEADGSLDMPSGRISDR